jgi:hypothetical protein
VLDCVFYISYIYIYMYIIGHTFCKLFTIPTCLSQPRNICVCDYKCTGYYLQTPCGCYLSPLKRKIIILVTVCYFVYKETVIVQMLPTHSDTLFQSSKLFAVVYFPLCVFAPPTCCCYCLLEI